eukprot:8294289-Alexandrium_andersonii.AAC.1
MPTGCDRSHLGQACSTRAIRLRASKLEPGCASRVSRASQEMQTASLSLRPSGDSGARIHEPRATTAGPE